MKIIYITAKKYPGKTADHNYIKNLALAFSQQLNSNFKFVVCNTDPFLLSDFTNLEVVSIPKSIKRTIFFFFWIPFFQMRESSIEKKKDNKRIIFFSNDQNILAVLILWKKILRFSYDVAVDWHMLTGTWKDKFIAKNSDYNFSTSNKLKETIKKISPLININTVYGGVDIRTYKDKRNLLLNTSEKDELKDKLKKELGLPLGKFLIGYVGLFTTMGMEKGISTMIHALPLLDENCAMVFVGGKKQEIEEYSQFAKSLNVFHRCIFLPIQEFDNVVKYELAMDILTIPYPDKPHFREYGFPMKIYEYMASGVPIVYTKLGLIEEVVGEYAYGVKPDSSLAMSLAISSMKENNEKWKNLATEAQKKVEEYTWQARASNIINVFDIMPSVLNIPNQALKYILFQRTEFSIYAQNRMLLRAVMNRRIPIYNFSVNLEAFLFKKRTKRLFSLDMVREYNIIKNYIPKNPKNILDIGSGVAGIDIMLHKHYKDKEIDFHLLDKTEVNSKVYYGIEKEAAYYNSLNIAKNILMANGIEEKNIHTQEVRGKEIFPGKRFDMIISLISWGFHYPVNTYIDEVYDALVTGGVLIIDVRKNTEGEDLLLKKFGLESVIYEAQKYRRMFLIKR